MSRLSIDIPEELHDKLRHEKILIKKSIKELLLNLAEEYFEKKGKELDGE